MLLQPRLQARGGVFLSSRCFVCRQSKRQLEEERKRSLYGLESAGNVAGPAPRGAGGDLPGAPGLAPPPLLCRGTCFHFSSRQSARLPLPDSGEKRGFCGRAHLATSLRTTVVAPARRLSLEWSGTGVSEWAQQGSRNYSWTLKFEFHVIFTCHKILSFF